MSKRSAVKDNSDFSKPKYQSIYAKKTTANTSLLRGKAAASEERVIQPKRGKQAVVVKEEKNATSKSEREPLVKEEEEEFSAESSKTEIKTYSAPEKEEVKTPEQIITNKKETEYVSEPIEPKGKTAAAIKREKQAEAAKSAEQKQQRKNSLKKISLGKKDPTSCPDF